MLTIRCVIKDGYLPVLNPVKRAWVFRRLVNFKKGAFWLCDYLVIDRLEVLQKLGYVLRVDVDGDVKANTSVGCHVAWIERVARRL